jgi:hypothetical protein
MVHSVNKEVGSGMVGKPLPGTLQRLGLNAINLLKKSIAIQHV